MIDDNQDIPVENNINEQENYQSETDDMEETMVDSEQLDNNKEDKNFETLLKEHKNLIDQNCNKKIYSVEILKYVTKNKRNYAVVDCRLKSECLCPIEELHKDHKIGDLIEVMVISTRIEDYIQVSCLKAQLEKKKKNLKKYRDQRKPIEATIIKPIKGGYNIDIQGYPGFLKTGNVFNNNSTIKCLIKMIPTSSYKTNQPRIICIEDNQRNLANKIVKCTIKQMNDFFVFVNVHLHNNGEDEIKDGIIHINDLSNKKINHPMDLFKIGDEIKAVIRRIEPNQLFLSVKYIYNLKTKEFIKKHKVDDIIECSVVNCHSNGIDVRITQYVTAFIPRSESAWGSTPSFKEDEKIQAKIIELNVKNKKIILSIKRLIENPLEQFKLDYPIKSKISFKIKDKKELYVLGEVNGVIVRLYDNEFHWIYTQSKKQFDQAQIGDEIEACVYKYNPKNCGVYVTKKIQNSAHNLQLNQNYQCKIKEITRSGLIVNIIDKDSTGFIKRSHCSDEINVNLQHFQIDQIVEAELISVMDEKKMPLLSIKATKMKLSNDLIKDYKSVAKTSFTDLIS